MAKAMLIDITKCTGCRGCQAACKQWNDLPAETTYNWGSYENPPDLSYNTWTKVRFFEFDEGDRVAWYFRKHQCLHCTDAACVKVCPTGALFHHEMGFVALDPEKCNGCGYCTQFCPFGVPRLEIINAFTGAAKASKCNFCQDRVTNGEMPACAKACPTGAILYGDQAELIGIGDQRVEELKAQGYANAVLYGKTELGGLHQMYVLPDKPSRFGLPDKPSYPSLANVWQDIIQPLGQAAVGLTALGLAVNFFIARRRIKAEEHA